MPAGEDWISPSYFHIKLVFCLFISLKNLQFYQQVGPSFKAHFLKMDGPGLVIMSAGTHIYQNNVAPNHYYTHLFTLPQTLSLSPLPEIKIFQERRKKNSQRERQRVSRGGKSSKMDEYTREMMDLKTLVTRTLEKKGVLAKIRV